MGSLLSANRKEEPHETTFSDIPEEHKSGIDISRDMLRRAHVLVVCGNGMTEDVKNDIAVAGRLNITATTLDGILTVKGKGREARCDD